MKAVVAQGYGPPGVLSVIEMDEPVPTEDEVLVAVRSSSVNAADIDQLRGRFAPRLGGRARHLRRVLGSDIAGVVMATGGKEIGFHPGDEVFADLTEWGFGAFAEYVTVPEAALVRKPRNLSFEEAAAAPTAGTVALLNMESPEGTQEGQKVLVNGAGGGMGTFAVQIAKHCGGEVTGVDSREKLGIVESIGADHVIDFVREDFTKTGECYDLILDVAAHHSIFACRRALARKGCYRFVGGTVGAALQAVFLGPILSKLDDRNLGILMCYPKKKDLTRMQALLETGAIRPVVDRVFHLSETAAAMRYLESGSAQGKVVISVS